MSNSDKNTSHSDDTHGKTELDETHPTTSAQIISYKQHYLSLEEGLEDVQGYNIDGYHPVQLGDILDDRFEVVHKLGSGGFSTVWLCLQIKDRWRAIKVMKADYSSESIEKDVMKRRVGNSSIKELEENHIVVPSEDFWVEGPNGRHLCFVLPVLGPTVSDWRIFVKNADPTTADRLKNVYKQTAQALSFLHRNGVCHGDFRPNNIMMQLKEIDQVDKDQMMKLVGEPELMKLRRSDGSKPGPAGPEYCVYALSEVSRGFRDFHTDQVAIVDFGEAFFVDTSLETTGIPNTYAAPEILFRQRPGFGVDIWSMACTSYEIRTGHALLSNYRGTTLPLVVFEMEVLLGPLTAPYRDVWEKNGYERPDTVQTGLVWTGLLSFMNRLKWMWTPSGPEPVTCTHEGLSLHQQDRRELSGYKDPFHVAVGLSSIRNITRDEIMELGDLLKKMIRCNPEERIPAEVVCHDQWFEPGARRSPGLVDKFLAMASSHRAFILGSSVSLVATIAAAVSFKLRRPRM